MTEFVGALFRWTQLASSILILGTFGFLVLAGPSQDAWVQEWRRRLLRWMPALALLLAAGLAGVLVAEAVSVTGSLSAGGDPREWYRLATRTRFGTVWSLRAVLALLLVGAVLLARRRWALNQDRLYIVCAGLAASILGMASFSSHAAGFDPAWPGISTRVVHTVAAGIWLGGLAGFGTLLYGAARSGSSGALPYTVRALNRFSAMALFLMLTIVGSGVLTALRQVETFSALLATPYGRLVIAKAAVLCSILAIAARARWVWLPAIAAGPYSTTPLRSFGRRVSIELALGLALLAIASTVSITVPARHVDFDWPFPFRFSIDAAWDEPGVQSSVVAGLCILVLGAIAPSLHRLRRWGRARLIAIVATLAALGLGLALPSLAVKANRDTYRKTTVPFDALSIANGASRFAENCAVCHGPQGKGNGVNAKNSPKPPADLLTEPHTAKHTAGDFFWWLTEGIPEAGMPAFGNRLTEEERWDIVNFLHALSRGYQSRLLRERVVPDQPMVGAPDFSYSAQNGPGGTLKDFRKKKAVLLVLFTVPQSRQRLERLRALYDKIRDGRTELLAVPLDSTVASAIAADAMPFPVAAQGASEISRTYALFRRTLSNPDLLGAGAVPPHMEILIDRYGYLRARWIPAQESPGWTDPAALLDQLAQLNGEKEVRPPPDDHVH